MRKEKLAIHGGKPVREIFLPLGEPQIEEPEIQEVVDCLRSGWLTMGPRVKSFEEMFKEYVGSQYAVALNSCTAALELSLIAAGIGPGDEVITTPLTFAATANVIIHQGARPVFVDVERRTMNIDTAAIEASVKENTKAIIPVHFAGYPCEMDEIREIAKKYVLKIIEDAAHAIGAEYKGKKIGSLGDLTCFSFYPTKHIVTGEGGIVTTDCEEWAEQIRIYSLHGLSHGAWNRYSKKGSAYYEIVAPGYNYIMMDIQAALGIHQFPRIDNYIARRMEIWNYYDSELKELPVILPPRCPEDLKHAALIYPILLDDERLISKREEIQDALRSENIGSSVHFISLHLHPYYQKAFGYCRGQFPNAEYISNRTLSLPFSAKLTDKDVEDVVVAFRKVITQFNLKE